MTGESGIGYLGVPRSATVSDAVGVNGWKIRNRGQSRYPEVYAILAATTMPFHGSEEDVVLWRADEDEFNASFPSAKTWSYLREKRCAVTWRKLTWFSEAVPHHAFMVCLAFRDRLYTEDRMRNWGIEQCCVLCGVKNETRDHLYFACP